jgi:methyl-accepting chemotaxis protein
VVADEVRKLAERSATSTREIGQILSTLRRETVEAAESMRASRSDMEAGSAFAQEANAALAIVAEKIAETSRIAAEIVSGSATMRTASARATSNIEGVSAIIGHNAAAASEVDGTTGNVRDFLASIASQSNAQSAAAGEVTSSVLSLAEHVQQLGVTAEAVAAEAQRMLDIVGYFQPGADRSAAPGYPNRGYLRSSEARNSSVSGAAERLPASA